ncbi:MAG: cation transporter [Magnetococcus sp. WYHC-3]
MNTVTLSVAGMSCHHCVGTVQRAVVAISGVTDCAVDLAQAQVTCVLAPDADGAALRARIAQAITEEGYTVKD